ncbi:MAG: M23 family metallopeptidase [Deltaproteobacteria bacterium]|nr:M23 family metallopeptidase [Deltaproteobacteria bacterium]
MDSKYLAVIFLLGSLFALPGCGPTLTSGPPHVTPPNAPPIISDWNSDISTDGVSIREFVHKGIDIGGEKYRGEYVIAAADGIVSAAYWGTTGGWVVKIYHGVHKRFINHQNWAPHHFYSVYAHCDELIVKKIKELRGVILSVQSEIQAVARLPV